MLETLTRIANGFVAVPVIDACRTGGLFRLLSEGARSTEAICQHLQANTGHLRTALRLLESLGWVDRNPSNEFILAPDSRLHRQIPGDIVEIFRIPFETSLTEPSEGPRIARWIDRCRDGWDQAEEPISGLMDGMLLVPLLLALTKCRTDDHSFFELPGLVRRSIAELFELRGWCNTVDGQSVLTESGRFLLDRAPVTATVASYKPMLSRMQALLFGDAQAVFLRNEAGQETHIDRLLNVTGSGFQHEKFFADVDEIVREIFNREPISDQPHYVADMGCGDGTLLKRIYEIVQTQSTRGRALAQYPLKLIGLDFNQAALEATDRKLGDIPHIVLQGDIGNPEDALAELQRRGIEPEQVLHVRSFLDHDRPFLTPSDSTAIEGRNRFSYESVSTSVDGRLIPAPAAVQSLVEHLVRWARVVNRHGLVLLEVHSVKPQVVRRFIENTESLHFDAYHAFSTQHLVDADVFLMSLAEAGLFARPGFTRRYPRTFPFARIALHWLETRPYRIRQARPDDMPALLDLEEALWPEPLRATAAELWRRLDAFPDGQCVLETGGRVVAAIYCQRIASAESLRHVSFQNVPQLHRADGNVLQLLGMNVWPDRQDQGLGDQFLEFFLNWCELRSDIDSVVGITRCRNYEAHRDVSFSEYIQFRDAGGMLLDPIPRFHEAHGAVLRQAVPDYRPEDTANDGNGILIEYDIHNRERRKVERPPKAQLQNVDEIIRESILRLLGGRPHPVFSPTVALREMGLDSLDLMELRFLLNQALGTDLDSSFFFRYGTPNAIANYVRGTTAVPSLPVASHINGVEKIAIIGMACRFPGGVNDPDSFWRLLQDGIDAIGAPPPNRSVSVKMRQGGFLDGVDQFDASFFRISPREANEMDPQQRMLLEVSWHALEHAGIDPRSLAGASVGVFTGLVAHDYEVLRHRNREAGEYDAHFSTGNAGSIASGRVAYFLDFRGPAITVDTACSSSLTAVHLACQSLRSGDCSMALAGGINLILSPEWGSSFASAGMLALDGRCKTFDASADGYVRSEGCGVVVLKPLNAALADGDQILAVIAGTAINQDGASNGLTAPNGLAQEAVMRQALAASGCTPLDISYVEAHGTGTALGDPVETAALAAVYGADRSAEHPLIIGSVKTNIGHTEAAAGIAGLMKLTLALQNRSIPPHLHFRRANPGISLERIPAIIPTHTTPMPVNASGRAYGAVSSFGFSGTNAHAILEEAPPQDGQARRAPLPPHRFERKRYWLSDRRQQEHPLLGRKLCSPLQTIQFESFLSEKNPPFLADHRVGEAAILPAAAFLEMALAAGRTVDTSASWNVQDVRIDQALRLPREATAAIQTVLSPDSKDGYRFEIFSLYEGDWRSHCTGALARTAIKDGRSDWGDIRSRFERSMNAEAHYEKCSRLGIHYGPAFQCVERLWLKPNEALAMLSRAGAGDEPGDGYVLHPALLDAALQVSLSALTDRVRRLPVAIERVQIFHDPGHRAWSHAVVRPSEAGDVTADVAMYDDNGALAAEIQGLVLRAPQGGTTDSAWQQWLYRTEWRSAPKRARGIAVPDIVSESVFNQRELESSAAFSAQLEKGCAQLIWNVINEVGSRSTASSLRDNCGVIPRYHKLFARLLEILTEAGILRWDGELCRVLRVPEDPDALAILRWRTAHIRPELTLVERCGANLAAVLRGEVDPLSLLFPNGDSSDAESLYRHSPAFQQMNEVMRQVVSRTIGPVKGARRLRVLEIGGGTGATTHALLPEFDPATTEYVFTDVSKLFLAKAKTEFQQFPFVSYRILDIEKPPGSQEFARASFDVVIASNVLHATADLGSTLRHVRELLAPGGILALLEVTAPQSWIDLTFGLTEGWWKFTDTDLRPTHPLLSASQWQSVLKREGFTNISVVQPAPAESSGVYQQAVLMAQRPCAVSRWHIVDDRFETGQRLAGLLSRDGDGCEITAGELVLNADPASGVFYFANPAQDGHMDRAAMDECERLLQVTQALIRLGSGNKPRLWIVTRGAQPVEDRLAGLAETSLWGLARVIALEHPELACKCVDLDPADDGLEDLCAEVRAADSEPEVAYRNGKRYTARLAAIREVLDDNLLPQPAGDAYELQVSDGRNLHELSLETTVRRAPGHDEVEVEVLATGLNFRDVLVALGKYPGTSTNIGVEFAGRIIRLGEGVREFSEGDAVIGLGERCFAGTVITRAALVARKPEHLSFAEGATAVTAFLTAGHALYEIAQLRQGERVLIHSAAGGVGLAACRLAKLGGAELFVTASAPKWPFLRAEGIPNIFDSRSLAFADQILAATHGEGVDVVLNCFPGEYARKNLSLLRPGGRFIELGKADILSAEEAHRLAPACSYTTVDLMEISKQHPAVINRLMRQLTGWLEGGLLDALPVKIFPLERAKDAFRYMQQAKHRGKIAVTHGTLFHDTGAYLITGGLGGIGLTLAKWIAEHGGRHLILMGRAEPRERAVSVIEELRIGGATVDVVLADVSKEPAVAGILDRLHESKVRLRGVFHLAGVLSDALLIHQDRESFAKVMDPKVKGAWNLHKLTQHWTLDHFVLFSSIASQLGSPGQGNHAAANAFLDGIAHYRRGQGLAGLSINWGAWSETGAASDERVAHQIRGKGLGAMKSEAALDALEYALRHDAPEYGVYPVDWRAFLDRFGQSAFFEDFQLAAKAETLRESPVEMQTLSTPATPRTRMMSVLRDQLRAVLGMPSSEPIPPARGFFELGLDSLTSLEFRNRMQSSLGYALNSTITFDYPNLNALVDHLMKRDSPKPEMVANGHRHSEILNVGPALNDEELLFQRLEELGFPE